MKSTLKITVLAVLLIGVAPQPCFALTVMVPVTREGAKALGMEVRSAGTNSVEVRLDFKIEGKLKDFSRSGSGVELRIDNPLVTAPLKEDRSKPGRVAVSFTADRAQLDKLKLWVTVPESDGRTIYDLRVKDFVEVKKDR